MKDIQGVQRGKCNLCECEEYHTRSPPQPGLLRCEYCNHTPVDHVKIIELGACNACGKDGCDKYQSENPNSYTDCEYCGCTASKHAGAEKLRKPTPQNQQAGAFMTAQMMMQSGGSGADFQPRQDAYGQPVQQVSFGKCKCPGCDFPKRREGDKVHDFCSRTCAKKFSEIQSSFYQQKVAAVHSGQQGGSPQGCMKQAPPMRPIPSGPPSAKPSTSSFSGMQGLPMQPSGPGPMSSTTIPVGPPQVAGKMCSKCGVRQANRGKGWCQQCFMQSSS